MISVVCLDGHCMYSCASDPDADIANILGSDPYTNDKGDLVFCEENSASGADTYPGDAGVTSWKC